MSINISEVRRQYNLKECIKCKKVWAIEEFMQYGSEQPRCFQCRVDYIKKHHGSNWQYVMFNNEFRIKKRSHDRRIVTRESRVAFIRWRAREKGLPATFTLEQWRACLEYWNGCCAVCGKQLRDLFGNVEPHADHWLPLSKGGGSEAKNMICLCSECNMNKHDAMPNEWLTQKFGQRRAKAISENVKKYFTQFD